jgi:DNA-binding SARP family transcriptional activator
MAESPKRFAQLLTEAIHRIRRCEGKKVSVIQDELGYELGREGGTAIEYWRKGHIPIKVADVVTLARLLIRRGKLDRNWLEEFLSCAGVPQQDALCEELFSTGAPQQSLAQGLSQMPVMSPRYHHSPQNTHEQIPQKNFSDRRMPAQYKPSHQDWEDALSPLQIHLLGGFQLYKDNLPVLLNQPRQQLLLTYLLLRRHTPQSRQHLSFLFWPDSSDAQAQGNLRTLLNRLHRAFPEVEHFLAVNARTIQWRADTPFILDVAQFEEAVAQATQAESAGPIEQMLAALEQAANGYRGDLLPGFYEDWLLAERERLSGIYRNTLERLIHLLESQRAYKEAIEYAQQLIHHDPLYEDGYQTLMRLQALAGDRSSALRTYQIGSARLQQELGVEPDLALQEAYERLQQVKPLCKPLASTSTTLSLVGRQVEWKQLQDTWRATVDGEPRLVLLRGEAGIGKTRLAEEMLTWARRQGITVAASRAYAAERALAYAPVIDWLRTNDLQEVLSRLEDAWLVEVARLLPELLVKHPHLPSPGPLVDGWQRQRMFEALARAFTAHNQPLILLVDDLHWSDDETLAWLHYLLRYPSKKRLLLISTVCNEEVADGHSLIPWLALLQRQDKLIEIALEALNQAEVMALAAQVVGRGITPTRAEKLFQETEGNPLFVIETVRAAGKDLYEPELYLETTHTLSLLEDAVPADPLPPKIYSVIQTRLNRLSTFARELVDLAATIGRSFSIKLLVQIANSDEKELVQGLDELWQRRIVRELGEDMYDFSHVKLREVAYNSMSPAKRRLFHHSVAQALEAINNAPVNLRASNRIDIISGKVAMHYELSADFQQAISWYQRAAEMAQRVYASASAIHYYHRALTLLEEVESRSCDLASFLSESLSDLLYLTGKLKEAHSIYQSILNQEPQETVMRARLYRKIGNLWRDQRYYAEALDAYAVARGILTSTTSTDPDNIKITAEPDLASCPSAYQQEWIQLQIEINTVHYWLGETESITRSLQKLQPYIEEVATADQCASFFQHRAIMAFRCNGCIASAQVVADARAALAAQVAADNVSAIPSAHFQLGFVTLWHGESTMALEPLQTALRLAEQSGDISLQSRCLAYLAIAYRQLEQIEETEAFAVRSLATAITADMPEYIGLAIANVGWVAWRMGELNRAEELGSTVLEIWQQLPGNQASMPFKWTLLWPLIDIALTRADLSAAMEYLKMLLDPAQQRLASPLLSLIEQSLHAWIQKDCEQAQSWLKEAIRLARQLHYL